MHKGSRKKNILQIAGLILAIVFIVSIVFIVGDFFEKKAGVYSGEEWVSADGSLDFNDREYTLKSNLETLLVVGLDAFGETDEVESYNNEQLADFLMLLVLDHEDKTVAALQINRDTVAEMNVLGVAGEKIGTVEQQIALAHTYGNGKEVSCRNVANAVSELLGGISIKHYASATMDVVPVMTDLVDGVAVTLSDDFTEINSAFKKGETVTLKGDDALAYVRARYGLEDSTNESRMERQRQFLGALHQEMLLSAEEDEAFIENAALELSKYMVSDCSVNQLEGIMNKASSYDFLGTKTIAGDSVVEDGYMEFHPDETALKQTVIDLFYQIKE